MRMARIKPKDRDVIFHCMSRIVGNQRLIGAIEKECFRKTMWALADFLGVQILSYCIMSNHFHILVKVPNEVSCDDAVLVERATRFYGAEHSQVKMLARQLKLEGKIGEDMRSRLLARMGDVSCFVKELKQRFSAWYNRRNGRFGTLWSERFRSTVVEESIETLRIVAGYIDLNSVRAGIVTDPKDYRFCNYAEAVAGRKGSREAIMQYAKGEQWRDAASDYRECLYIKGGLAKRAGQLTLDQDAIVKELRRGATLGIPELLRLRIRYIADGVALGSADFVNGLFTEYRDRFGRRRKSGARSLSKCLAPLGLKVIRDLRKDPCG